MDWIPMKSRRDPGFVKQNLLSPIRVGELAFETLHSYMNSCF
jgi:hypothetical protein